MIKIILLFSIVISITMLGCLFPILEPLPTYTPAPVQQIVVTPTPIPESEWYCLKGTVELNSFVVGPDGKSPIYLVGEQLICGRDWKISGLYGPVGYLDSNPEKVITFGDLIDSRKNLSDDNKD